MRSTLVDSNVLIDLLDEASEWRGWSDAIITECGNRGPLIINPIIYAEVAAGFDDLDEVDDARPTAFLKREALPWAAACVAGHAFVRYRRLGGQRPALLPDFYIGAHAAVAGHTLLTRDPRRYRYYVPKLRIVSP
jgi:predicted nucleic acid-binding protein